MWSHQRGQTPSEEEGKTWIDPFLKQQQQQMPRTCAKRGELHPQNRKEWEMETNVGSCEDQKRRGLELEQKVG